MADTPAGSPRSGHSAPSGTPAPRSGSERCSTTTLPGVRGAALDALAKLGPGVDGDGADCARLLADPAPHVRIAAVRAVARLVKHPGAMLASAVRDKDRLVRLEVARHVAGLPERAANTLLGDPDLRVREAAARGAGVRELGALAVLLTDDPARDVRRASAHTLGAMRGERVADVLVLGVEDPDALVRAAVLHALETLLTREGAVGRLCDELTSDRPERRRASVYALAHLRRVSRPRPRFRGLPMTLIPMSALRWFTAPKLCSSGRNL